ncbi:Aste57867_20955 [Aphanomyces stellatus]|uniref:Aste57867_20955 protein n=1 Tax=Aphanomyces stellatus TaxID=120398 RepID=A0A485LHQ1_9STRA|nr:hypothetical protein As57867_020887 [Aphanomyces stellatus]VFT97631.1 Aste57867_20955 [Aphanomyces stellatus]
MHGRGGDTPSQLTQSIPTLAMEDAPAAAAPAVLSPAAAPAPAAVVKKPTPVATPVPVAVPVAAATETAGLLPPSASATAMNKFKQMEIERINGYLRIINLIGGFFLGWLGAYNFYHLDSYKGFMASLFLIVQAVLIILFELRENFPNASKIVHDYLGFMYTAYGRGALYLVIGTWCPTQGPYGVALGVFYCFLAVINFFIILQHPGYRNAMSRREITVEEDDDATPFYGSTAEDAPAKTV